MIDIDAVYAGQRSIIGPADYSFAITPNDGADLARVTRMVRATNAGTVVWHNVAGEAQTTVFAAGEQIPIRARRVLATGTTAGMGLYGFS